jgi:hypothetical protein
MRNVTIFTHQHIIPRMTKPRRTEWAGHVICEMHKIAARTHTKRALGDLGTNGPPGQLMWKAFKRVDRVQGKALHCRYISNRKLVSFCETFNKVFRCKIGEKGVE